MAPLSSSALPSRIEAREFRSASGRCPAGGRGALVCRPSGVGPRRPGSSSLRGPVLSHQLLPELRGAAEPGACLGPGQWSARGHGALILPVEGPSALIVDTKAFRDDLAVADEVIFSEDVVGAAAAAMKRLTPHGQIGLMGTDSLCWTWHETLLRAVGPRLVHADEIGPQLRLVKSPAELALLGAASEVGARALDAVMDAAVPARPRPRSRRPVCFEAVSGGAVITGIGISSGDHGGSYCQSQPAPYDSRYVLQEGDMIRVDLYGSIDGYWFDVARTRVVGREPTEEQTAVMNAARDSVLAGIEVIAPGVTVAK